MNRILSIWLRPNSQIRIDVRRGHFVVLEAHFYWIYCCFFLFLLLFFVCVSNHSNWHLSFHLADTFPSIFHRFQFALVCDFIRFLLFAFGVFSFFLQRVVSSFVEYFSLNFVFLQQFCMSYGWMASLEFTVSHISFEWYVKYEISHRRQ